MTRGTVKVTLRPIKLAFLVNPNDRESLLKAIEINTFLWGGTYNPIIPTYERIPSAWKVPPYDNPTAKSVVSGYLDNFDPDYVVPIGKCAGYSLDVGYRERIDDVSEILAQVEKRKAPNYGIGLFEILNYFFQEELKFQRRYPEEEDICVPRFNTDFTLFFSSVFGVLPKNIDKVFWESFAEALDAEKIDCSASNYTEFFNRNKLFLRRMTGLYLRSSGRQGKLRIFFLDATKPLDIMDYWNLRAVGWEVFPVPKQFTKSDKTQTSILNFIREECLTHVPNPEVYYKTTIFKSRSISDHEHRHFLDSLEESKVVSQTQYPRIWDESARTDDHVESCTLIADRIEHDVSTDQEPIRFKTLDPKFIRPSFGLSEPIFANEIEWRLSDDKVIFAEVIPEGDSKQAFSIVAESIGLRLHTGMRIFKNGVVYLPCSSEQSLFLRDPHAEGVLTRWLESKGWEVELSPPGRIAKQMIWQLGGINGTSILAQKGIIQLLGKMNNKDKKSMSEASVWGEIQQIANANQMRYKTGEAAERTLQQLIEAKVFQLGIKVQCPICTKHSWYSVKDTNYELQCSECLAQFPFPYTSKEVKWTYRTLGPFSSSNQADGAYTVLLMLRFFFNFPWYDGAMTPLMSFTAKKDQMEIEADLALFFQESKSRHSKMKLIFAECKTFNYFEKKDIDRMKDLGKEFPGAILVFATLKKSLDNEEKEFLRPLVKRSRKNRINGSLFNPVLILTRTELISEAHFTDTWRKSGGIRKRLANSSTLSNLLELCDFTQQIYLDMKPWKQTAENYPET